MNLPDPDDVKTGAAFGVKFIASMIIAFACGWIAHCTCVYPPPAAATSPASSR